MAYHTLAVRSASGHWAIEFGSYDREDVVSEIDSARDHGVKKSDCKIIRTKTARQSEIDAAMNKLNAAVTK